MDQIIADLKRKHEAAKKRHHRKKTEETRVDAQNAKDALYAAREKREIQRILAK